jgi:hypothetical protein
VHKVRRRQGVGKEESSEELEESRDVVRVLSVKRSLVGVRSILVASNVSTPWQRGREDACHTKENRHESKRCSGIRGLDSEGRLGSRTWRGEDD